MSLITMSVFFRTTMHHKTMADGSKFYERFSVLPFVGLCAAYLGTKDSTITHGILDMDLPHLLYHWICSKALQVLLPILGVFWHSSDGFVPISHHRGYRKNSGGG
ncbi:hypothetical protein Droror1_Dr00026914 [Drosera rotundifolia]